MLPILEKLETDIKEIRATQERILAIVEDALCPTTSSDFERARLISQHGGNALAAFKEHNRRQKAHDKRQRLEHGCRTIKMM